MAHLAQNERQVAQRALTKAIELNPNYLQARLVLADLHLKAREPDLAEKQSDAVLALAPKNPQALLIAGNAAMAEGKKELARERFETLIAIEPENPAGYYRLGVLQRVTGDIESARENLEKALQLNPKLMDVFTQLVLTYAARKEYDAALTRCDRQMEMLSASKTHTAIINDLKGGLYLVKKAPAKAEAAFQAAIKADPNYMKPYYALARIYLSRKEEDKAIVQYEQILKKNPQQAGPHMLLGTIYDMKQDFDQSEKHYRAALEIDAGFAPAANNLAYLLASEDKDLNQALSYAQTAKEKRPEDPNVMDTLGWVYLKKGLYDSAIREFNGSLETLFENPTVFYHLGLAQYKKGDKDAAKAALEKALALGKDFDGAQEARRILGEL
jgi:tetratricopeptide (TPR) repeat protein